MTSITQASLRYVQELGTFLGPQNRTQGRCGMLSNSTNETHDDGNIIPPFS